MSIKESWWEEKRSAYIYLIMADVEIHPLRKKLFLELANAAESQSQMWVNQLKQADQEVPSFYPNARTRLVGWLIKKLGAERLRYVLSAMKVRGMSVFIQPHHEALHRGVSTAGNLRAAVFGVNDGLISNVSLILGFAGANADHSFIVLAGVAGLLAGACSMAAGEYVSVRSQREVFEHQIQLEKNELELYPEEEMEELALIYQARGVPREQAINLSELLIKNPETALDTLAREELGLNPDDLGSPIGAMISSFISFAIGASIPIIPFWMGNNLHTLEISVGISAVSLFVIGTLLSLFTNKNAFKSGLRMLLIGVIAGAITYFIGHYLGVKLM